MAGFFVQKKTRHPAGLDYETVMFRLFFRNGFPVFQESFDTLGGQWVFDGFHQSVEWNGCDVAASLCSQNDVFWSTDGCSDDLGVDVVQCKDFCDFADKVDTFHADVVQSAYEW